MELGTIPGTIYLSQETIEEEAVVYLVSFLSYLAKTVLCSLLETLVNHRGDFLGLLVHFKFLDILMYSVLTALSCHPKF